MYTHINTYTHTYASWNHVLFTLPAFSSSNREITAFLALFQRLQTAFDSPSFMRFSNGSKRRLTSCSFWRSFRSSTCVCVCTCMNVCMYVCVYVLVSLLCMYMFINLRIIYTYIYTHMHV